MTLSDAQKIIHFLLTAARRNSAPPLAVAVVDSGGNMLAFAREDGAPVLWGNMAQGKAWSSVMAARPTRLLQQMSVNKPAVARALVDVTQGQLVALTGGVPVASLDGVLVGGVGVSGDTSENDEAYAFGAISDAGLQAVLG